MLEAYDDNAREDITDADRLRAILDELQTVLTDIETRLSRLEDA